MVRIVVEPLPGAYAKLKEALEKRYELSEAVIVETSAYSDQAVVAWEAGVGAAE